MPSSPPNQTNDLVSAGQVIAALEGYRHLFAPQDIGKASDFNKPVTVYMGGQNNTWQPFYRDATADTPGLQKLSNGQLDFMKWVTAKPLQNPGQDDPIHKQNGNLRIDVGEQTVFTMANGYVLYNALKDADKGQENAQIQPGGKWPNAPGDKKKQQAADPAIASDTVPGDGVMSPDMTPSPGKGLSSTALKRYLDQLETQVVEPTATDYVKSRVAQTRWQAAQYEWSSNQNKRIVAVAHTLLKHHGVGEGGRLVYQAEGYQLEADARTICIRSANGLDDERLFEAKKTLGSQYKVITNSLTPAQMLDFNKTHFLLQKVGVKGLASDPRLRKQQLEALAPQGDRAMAQDLTSHALAKTAQRFLNHLKVQPNKDGVRELRGQYYTITQQGEILKISAQGRGVILNVGPKINTNSVTPKDISYFRSLSQRYLPGRGLPQQQQLGR